MNLDKYKHVFENPKSTVKQNINALNELKDMRNKIDKMVGSMDKSKKTKNISMNNIDDVLSNLQTTVDEINLDNLESIKKLLLLKPMIENSRQFLINNKPNIYKCEGDGEIDITEKIKSKFVIRKTMEVEKKKKVDAEHNTESDSIDEKHNTESDSIDEKHNTESESSDKKKVFQDLDFVDSNETSDAFEEESEEETEY